MPILSCDNLTSKIVCIHSGNWWLIGIKCFNDKENLSLASLCSVAGLLKHLQQTKGFHLHIYLKYRTLLTCFQHYFYFLAVVRKHTTSTGANICKHWHSAVSSPW